MGNIKMPAGPNYFLESAAQRMAQQGNAAAFEFLYRRHRKRVYCFCLRMVKDPIQAEDLTQDTFPLRAASAVNLRSRPGCIRLPATPCTTSTVMNTGSLPLY